MIALPMSPPAVIAVSTNPAGLVDLFNHSAKPSVKSWADDEVSSFGSNGFDPAQLNSDSIARSALSPNPNLSATILRYVILSRLMQMVTGHGASIPGVSDQTTSAIGAMIPGGGSAGGSGGALGSLAGLATQRQQTLGGLQGFLGQSQSAQAAIIHGIK